MTIRFKLVSAFFLLFVFLIVQTVCVTYFVRQLQLAANTLNAAAEARQASYAATDLSVKIRQQAELTASADKPVESIETWRVYWQEFVFQMELVQQSTKALALDEQLLASLTERFQTTEEEGHKFDEMVMASQGDTDALAEQGFYFDDAVSTLDETLSVLGVKLGEQLEKSIEREKEIHNRPTQAAAIITLVSAVLIGVVAWVLAGRFVAPIRVVVSRVAAIADGDLTGDELPVCSRDELADLTQSVNEMSDALNMLVSNVSGSADGVAAAAMDMAAVSEEISRGMEQQGKEVAQVSSAIEQMSASIVEVAHKSADAAKNADESGQVAKEGGHAVEQTIEGMKAIDEAVSSSSTAVTELGRLGEQIGRIIEVINDIADQTNLLALNAAIEAARAGEHGRGFSVVADEVRKLADRTTKATAEVGDSIKAIQTGTSEAVQRMDAGTNQVKVGVERAQQSGQSLGQIMERASAVATMVQSIAAAAEQQSAAGEQVSRSITTIGAITEKVAREGSSQAGNSVQGLVERSTQLQTVLRHFKLRLDVTGETAKWTRHDADPVRILLAEDDEDALRLLQKHLEGRGECTVTRNGREVVDAFRAMLEQEHSYDLVCLDVIMPQLDGREALAELRALEQSFGLERRQRAKIAMITALDTPLDKLKAFRASCDAYITKPVNKSQLLEAVSSLGVREHPASPKG